MKIGKFIAAVVVGLAVAFPAMADISPVEIKGATTVSVSKAKELFEKEVAFIDVRKNSDWDAGRIPGAVHIELKKVFSEAKLLEVVKKDKPVVFYCNGGLPKQARKQ
jgi:rhodanese-related sulfurtransferase